jgi:uncharacterized heparinase superfamily protein
VQREDILTLESGERKLLDAAFDPQAGARQARNIMLDGLLLAIFGAAVAAWSLTEGLILAVLIAYVAFSIIEKITYARALGGYRSLVQKLVHRVERLEGVTLTPDTGHPTESARAARATAPVPATR